MKNFQQELKLNDEKEEIEVDDEATKATGVINEWDLRSSGECVEGNVISMTFEIYVILCG